jgi:hypothetical protein
VTTNGPVTTSEHNSGVSLTPSNNPNTVCVYGAVMESVPSFFKDAPSNQVDMF